MKSKTQNAMSKTYKKILENIEIVIYIIIFIVAIYMILS